jgi:hypothetical protein
LALPLAATAALAGAFLATVITVSDSSDSLAYLAFYFLFNKDGSAYLATFFS